MTFTAKYVGKGINKGFYLFAFPPESEGEEVDVVPYRVAEKDLPAIWETIGKWAQFERYEVKSFNEIRVYVKVATK